MARKGWHLMAKSMAQPKELPIFTYYDVQRYLQFSPQDCANWYIVQAPTGKRKRAMYPCMGRAHVEDASGINVLLYDAVPRFIFKSIDFMYVVVESTIYKVSKDFSAIIIGNVIGTAGFLSFDYLPLVQAAGSTSQTQAVFVMVSDGHNLYVIDETTDSFTTITDSNAPKNPMVVKAFGNRFAVSSANSTEFRLTQVNCYDTVNAMFDASTLFTVPGAGGLAVFAQENGIIKQMVTLHNTLYIFSDFECGIWSNIPSAIAGNTTTTASSIFPWKKNTSLNWDYGIADPNSIDVDFGRMMWLAQNRNGLIEFMWSDGQMPKSLSTQAINVLLQQSSASALPASYRDNATGFLYQYEDTIFYRVSSGTEATNGELIYDSAGSLEYNFETGTWGRCIEVDGDRNLIHQHVYFSNLHIVSVLGQQNLYQMAGNIYVNEFRNTAVADPQSPLAFVANPMRYELITSIISEDFYQEFKTNWLQIDFVWGRQTYVNQPNGAFQNAVYIISESSTPTNTIYLVEENGTTFLLDEAGNTPVLDETIYDTLFKPNIELFFSDDGGVTYQSADIQEFSQLGVYSWRMRWYQLGNSRNRVYKLACVSPSPLVILGGIHETEVVSGGAL